MQHTTARERASTVARFSLILSDWPFDTGHIIPFNQSHAEIFDWLDRYLGPVK